MGHYSAGLMPRATSHNLLGAKGTRHLNGSSLVCDTLAQRPHPKCRSKRCPRRRRRTVIRRDSSARLLPPEFVPGWDEFMFTFRGGLPAEHELFFLIYTAGRESSSTFAPARCDPRLLHCFSRAPQSFSTLGPLSAGTCRLQLSRPARSGAANRRIARRAFPSRRSQIDRERGSPCRTFYDTVAGERQVFPVLGTFPNCWRLPKSEDWSANAAVAARQLLQRHGLGGHGKALRPVNVSDSESVSGGGKPCCSRSRTVAGGAMLSHDIHPHSTQRRAPRGAPHARGNNRGFPPVPTARRVTNPDATGAAP
jgi:hypothetical protein